MHVSYMTKQLSREKWAVRTLFPQQQRRQRGEEPAVPAEEAMSHRPHGVERGTAWAVWLFVVQRAQQTV